MSSSRNFSIRFSSIESKGFDDPDDVLLYFDPKYDEMVRSRSPPKSPPKSPSKSPSKSNRNLSDSLDDLIKYTKDDWVEAKADPSNKKRDKNEGKKLTIEEQASQLSFSTSSLKTAWMKTNELIISKKKQTFSLTRSSKNVNTSHDNDNDDDDIWLMSVC